MSKASREQNALWELEETLGCFSALEDPRSSINRLHSLDAVLMISMMAVLAGAAGPTSIALWAREKRTFLESILELPHGVPSKDVIRRVLMAIKPSALHSCLSARLDHLRQLAEAAMKSDQPLLAIDGKTLRRSHDRSSGIPALHSVTVWASELGLTLAQVASDEKSNEITAIPEALDLVNIKGAIVTIDAMGTQKAIAEKIIQEQGDYVLALKGNHDKLHTAVIEHLNEQLEDDQNPLGSTEYVTRDKGHGRQEIRSYLQWPAPATLPGLADWAGLLTICAVVHLCTRNGKRTAERRLYISSLPMGVERIARAIRSHWSIENSCHWSLDFTYREDESRISHRNLRENCAWLSRFTLSLLKQMKDQRSVVMRRRTCGWNEQYLLQVLAGATT